MPLQRRTENNKLIPRCVGAIKIHLSLNPDEEVIILSALNRFAVYLGGGVKCEASYSPVPSVTSVIHLVFCFGFFFFCNLKYLMPTQNKAGNNKTIFPHESKSPPKKHLTNLKNITEVFMLD